MLDRDTFLTTLYVLVDDFVRTQPPAPVLPGPAPALSRSEVLTLLLLAQWRDFASQRDFYRFAQAELRSAFPSLPDRSQFLRQAARCHDLLVSYLRHLSQHLEADQAPYQVLDLTPVPVRDAKRRGRSWVEGQAALGHSTRLNWFFGFQLLLAVSPQGVITGFALAPGNTKDQPLADSFLQARQAQLPAAQQVGQAYAGPYITDKGFAGLAQRGHEHVLTVPQRGARRPWSKPWRQWLARRRQLVETVNEKLHNYLGLSRPCGRRHSLLGWQLQTATACTLHNLLIYLNLQLGRAKLAFADFCFS